MMMDLQKQEAHCPMGTLRTSEHTAETRLKERTILDDFAQARHDNDTSKHTAKLNDSAATGVHSTGRRLPIAKALQVRMTPAELGPMLWGGRTRLARFWEKVARGGLTECWLWQASKANGYGQLGEWRGEYQRPVRAHVVSWAIHHNRWPVKGEVVRHACDVKACVNPGHLLIGSSVDNIRDARERRRNPVWNQFDDRMSVLAAETLMLSSRRQQIAALLRLNPQPGVSDIARELGVSRQAICHQLDLMESAGLVRRCRYVITADLAAVSS